MKIEIYVEQFGRNIKAGKNIGGSNGALGSLIKTKEAFPNYVNSKCSKKVNYAD